jgi:hypothetical protein
VVVADPNFAPMYAARDKRVKTHMRDARAPCEACRLGRLPPRPSEAVHYSDLATCPQESDNYYSVPKALPEKSWLSEKQRHCTKSQIREWTFNITLTS